MKYKTRDRFVRLFCFECEDMGGSKEQFLTEREYEEQMNHPNTGWRCPACRTYPCGFDDEYFELPVNNE